MWYARRRRSCVARCRNRPSIRKPIPGACSTGRLCKRFASVGFSRLANAAASWCVHAVALRRAMTVLSAACGEARRVHADRVMGLCAQIGNENGSAISRTRSVQRGDDFFNSTVSWGMRRFLPDAVQVATADHAEAITRGDDLAAFGAEAPLGVGAGLGFGLGFRSGRNDGRIEDKPRNGSLGR